MIALGRCMHTLQDKYSHNNAGWFELMPFAGIDPDNPFKHPFEFTKAFLDSK